MLWKAPDWKLPSRHPLPNVHEQGPGQPSEPRELLGPAGGAAPRSVFSTSQSPAPTVLGAVRSPKGHR